MNRLRVIYTYDLTRFTSESVNELLNGPAQWQQQPWDKVYRADTDKSTVSYCVPQLSQSIYNHSHPLPPTDPNSCPLKTGRPLTRRTVLDYYPTSVDQRDEYLSMDRRFFPLSFRSDGEISEHLRALPSGSFYRVRSCATSPYADGFSRDNQFVPRANSNRIVLYETSEQHAPFRMQSLLSSQLSAYSTDARNLESAWGVPRRISRRSPFLGSLCDETGFQLALENEFFRAPVFQHRLRRTDFLLVLSLRDGNVHRFAVRPLDGALLAGKQMPLVHISKPKSNFFRQMMMVMRTFQLLTFHWSKLLLIFYINFYGFFKFNVLESCLPAVSRQAGDTGGGACRCHLRYQFSQY